MDSLQNHPVRNTYRYSGRDMLLGGLFMAVALVLPIVFHAVGMGSQFLPMFPPIIMAGCLTAWPVGLTVGILSPLVSAVLTGMPPFFPPVAWIMALEGAVMVLLARRLYLLSRFSIRATVILVLLADRLVLLGAVLAVATWLDLPRGVLGLVSVVRGAPGIVIMIVTLPPLIRIVESRLQFIPQPE
ncbi:MAG TPA: ECF transporter S component [Candidatus Aminicenantes bacterium]|nr:ECF transporter S component [Candidatus Aminicenantes bacterium]